MARLPSFRRIFEQDYQKDYQDLVRQLSVSINYGFEPLYEILNGKLSLTDNTASLITTITVTVDSSGKPKTKTTIRKTGTDRFTGFIVVKAENLTNSSVYTTGTPFINYTETSETITVNNVTGLPADNSFQLTLFGLR
jgi:hypothetical protein